MGKVQEKFPKRWQLFTEDTVNRLSKDCVVEPREGIHTFADLKIQPSPLKEDIAHLLLRHRGIRGPDRVHGFMGRPSKHQDADVGQINTETIQAGAKGHGF